jgi:hypothetical protein
MAGKCAVGRLIQVEPFEQKEPGQTVHDTVDEVGDEVALAVVGDDDQSADNATDAETDVPPIVRIHDKSCDDGGHSSQCDEPAD